MGTDQKFKPALLVIDMQEDFSPPKGSLAVDGARDVASGINKLLDMPGFAVKVATADWHPADHASFAHVHPPPNNRPFVYQVEMTNPLDPSETKKSTLWPSHCVQDTPGAAIIPEINLAAVDKVLRKGMDKRAEMYSGFRDIFGNRSGATFDLAEYLKSNDISHVYVTGVTGDCCAYHSAMDSARDGFNTILVEDLTRSITEADFDAAKKKMREAGVTVTLSTGKEVERVLKLGGTTTG